MVDKHAEGHDGHAKGYEFWCSVGIVAVVPMQFQNLGLQVYSLGAKSDFFVPATPP